MLLLPVQNDTPRYSELVTLDGVAYRLSFEWNDRAASWFLDIGTAAGVPLVTNVRLVVGWPLLSRYRVEGLPPGLLECIDTLGTDTDPAYQDLGGRVVLAYTPTAEL